MNRPRAPLPRSEVDGRPWMRAAGKQAEADAPYTLAEQYHENSKYHRRLLPRPSWEAVTAALSVPKRTGTHTVRLPPPAEDIPLSLGQVLKQRRSIRQFSPEEMALQTLSDLLFYTAGVTGTEHLTLPGNKVLDLPIRTYPSAGALFPVDVMVVVRRVQSVAPGVYQYDGLAHSLTALSAEPAIDQACLQSTFVHPATADLTDIPIILVLAASFRRHSLKYHERAYRLTLQEVGHLAQNALLVTTALGLAGLPTGAFFDDEWHRLLHMDGTDECVLQIVPIGKPALATSIGTFKGD